MIVFVQTNFLTATSRHREREINNPNMRVSQLVYANWSAALYRIVIKTKLLTPRNVRMYSNGYNLIKYAKSRRAVARHVYRPLFLRAAIHRSARRRRAVRCGRNISSLRRIARGKRVKRRARGGCAGKTRGAGEGVSSCRGWL